MTLNTTSISNPTVLGINFDEPTLFTFVLTESQAEQGLQLFAEPIIGHGAVGHAMAEDFLRNPADHLNHLRGLNFDLFIHGFDVMNQNRIQHNGTVIGVGFGIYKDGIIYATSASAAVAFHAEFSHLRKTAEWVDYQIDQEKLLQAVQNLNLELRLA